MVPARGITSFLGLSLVAIFLISNGQVSADAPFRASEAQAARPGVVDGETVDVWSSIPATELGKQVPQRWRKYLPSGASNKSKDKSLAVAQGVIQQKGQQREISKPVGSTVTSKTRKQAVLAPQDYDNDDDDDGYDDDNDAHDEDDDKNEDDDDDGDGEPQMTKKELERAVQNHLKRKAKQEAMQATRDLKRAARAASSALPANPLSSKGKKSNKSSVSPDGDEEEGHRNILDTLRYLWSFASSVAGSIWYLTRWAFRAGISSAKFVWSSIRYALRQGWWAFLTMWASVKWAVRHFLRPIRIVAAPVIYIFLGVKWTFWDVPSYYAFQALRVVYPLYVYCGAALALGTMIGLSGSGVLYIGHLIFSANSALESHMSHWRNQGTSDVQKRTEMEITSEKLMRQSLSSRPATSKRPMKKSTGKRRARQVSNTHSGGASSVSSPDGNYLHGPTNRSRSVSAEQQHRLQHEYHQSLPQIPDSPLGGHSMYGRSSSQTPTAGDGDGPEGEDDDYFSYFRQMTAQSPDGRRGSGGNVRRPHSSTGSSAKAAGKRRSTTNPKRPYEYTGNPYPFSSPHEQAAAAAAQAYSTSLQPHPSQPRSPSTSLDIRHSNSGSGGPSREFVFPPSNYQPVGSSIANPATSPISYSHNHGPVGATGRRSSRHHTLPSSSSSSTSISTPPARDVSNQLGTNPLLSLPDLDTPFFPTAAAAGRVGGGGPGS